MRLSRRARFVTQLIAFVIILGAVSVGADLGARAAAQALLARNIADSTGARVRPDVEIRGAVFLPQVIRGAYPQVHVVTRDITSGPLRIDEVDSTLTDVRLPFHDVLVQDVRTIGIGRSDERVVLRYDDLNAYFDITGRPLRLVRTAEGLTVTGTVDVLTRRVTVTADVEVAVSSGQLTITPVDIRTEGSPLSEAAALLLNQRLRLTVSLGAMPFGHTVTDVAVGDQAITLTAYGERILVRP